MDDYSPCSFRHDNPKHFFLLGAAQCRQTGRVSATVEKLAAGAVYQRVQKRDVSGATSFRRPQNSKSCQYQRKGCVLATSLVFSCVLFLVTLNIFLQE